MISARAGFNNGPGTHPGVQVLTGHQLLCDRSTAGESGCALIRAVCSVQKCAGCIPSCMAVLIPTALDFHGLLLHGMDEVWRGGLNRLISVFV